MGAGLGVKPEKVFEWLVESELPKR